ncbi:MAG: hypothetical protein HY081_10095 [Gammaproteobacteria bacterium]|nr:hypothetical protein [Gammaproteobacteria bacterium]
MKKLQYSLLILIAMCAQACTQRAWYEGVKQSHRNECNKGPASERDDCLKGTDESYDEYQRKKQEIKK